MIVLFGVIVFSRIAGLFVQILDDEARYNDTVDKGHDLVQMLSSIAHLNDNDPVDRHLRKASARHFKFVWENDHNDALAEDFGQGILARLP